MQLLCHDNSNIMVATHHEMEKKKESQNNSPGTWTLLSYFQHCHNAELLSPQKMCNGTYCNVSVENVDINAILWSANQLANV